MTETANDIRPAFARLRIVQAGNEAIPPKPEVLAGLRLIGVSTATDPLAVRPAAWHTLIECLEMDEVLELRHVHDARAPAGAMRYALEVRLLQSRGTSARTSRHLHQAFEASLPQLKWETLEGAVAGGRPAPRQLLPLQAVIRPGALALRANMAAPRSAPETADGDDREAFRLPYPAPLPSWPLTAPLEEPLLPGPWQLVIRLSKCQMSEGARTTMLRARQALLHGGDAIRWPGATDWHLAPGAELCKTAASLIAEALRFPERLYTVQVQVRADSSPSRFALHRLGQDLFGAFPFDVSHSQLVCNEDISPCGPMLTRHGTGAWFAHPSAMSQAGMPVQSKDPAKLPEGPGSMLGVTANGRPVLLPDTLRTSHTLVVGASGSGKSTLLRQLMLDDIGRGGGLALLDPHGELVDDLLGCMPASRADDVVVVDIADPLWRYSINPLQGTEKDVGLRNFVCGQVCTLIDKLFEEPQSAGPVTRRNVRLALMLAMSNPAGPTFADAVRVMEDDRFRASLLDNCTPDLQASFRTWTRTSGDTGFDNWKPYVTARLEPFCTSPLVSRVLNQPTTLDVPSLLRERRVVLFRLPKAEISEAESQILGSMILLQFHVAAMRGHATASPRRRPFQLFVDEFHAYCTPTVPSLFREARKFGIGLTVATQSVASIHHPQCPTLLDDVLGNTAIKVFFRLSPRDAVRIDEYTEPEFNAAAVARQANYRAVVSLPAASVPPFQIATTRPQRPSECADPAWLRERSGMRFGAPLGAIEPAPQLFDGEEP